VRSGEATETSRGGFRQGRHVKGPPGPDARTVRGLGRKAVWLGGCCAPAATCGRDAQSAEEEAEQERQLKMTASS
jgi:hypothetical protein